MKLIWHQFRFSQKLFWRNPASVFFTVLLPVMFLLIFATIFGDATTGVSFSFGNLSSAAEIASTAYYIPALVTLGVISATLQSLANALVNERETGVLKRLRGTPMPTSVFMAGRVGNAYVLALLSLVVISVIGLVLYGVDIPWSRLPQVLVVLAIGSAAFCCMGVALSVAIPSVEGSAPVTNFLLLPLYFLSGIFIPEGELPEGVLTVAGFFPVRPFFEAFLAAWDPVGLADQGIGYGMDWGALAVVVAWGAVAAIFAIRRFNWNPRR